MSNDFSTLELQTERLLECADVSVTELAAIDESVRRLAPGEYFAAPCVHRAYLIALHLCSERAWGLQREGGPAARDKLEGMVNALFEHVAYVEHRDHVQKNKLLPQEFISNAYLVEQVQRRGRPAKALPRAMMRHLKHAGSGTGHSIYALGMADTANVTGRERDLGKKQEKSKDVGMIQAWTYERLLKPEIDAMNRE